MTRPPRPPTAILRGRPRKRARLVLVAAVYAAQTGLPRSAVGGPKVRTTVTPRTDLGFRAGRRVLLTGGLGLPIWVAAPRPAVEGSLRAAVAPWRRVAFEGGYLYRHGRDPIEGPSTEEHRGSLGLVAGSPGRRVVVRNRTGVDLRGLYEPGRSWVFGLRTHNRTRVTFVLHPAARISPSLGLWVDPLASWRAFLQLRTGLALHGAVHLGRARRQGRPRFQLGYTAGAVMGLWPVAMALGGAGSASKRSAMATPWMEPLDVVLRLGLSARF